MTAEPVDRISLDWATGQERYRERFMGNMQQDFGAPYLMAHRADLHALLRSQVPESRIHLDAQCVGVSTTDGTATVALANGQEIEADVVVGADGIHSAVRSAFLGTEKPRFTNQIC